VTLRPPRTSALFRTTLLALALGLPAVASAQEGPITEERPDGSVVVTPGRQRPPQVDGAQKVTLDFVERNLWDLVLYFADLKQMNFVLANQKDLQGKTVTIVSHKPVSVGEAWEAFLSAMSVSGYTVVENGSLARVVKTTEAAQSSIPVGKGRPGRATESYVTQLVQLSNVSVSEVQKIIPSLMPSDAKIVAYQPTNTLIITDTATNIRKIYSILNELDVAAPKSTLEIVPIQFADAADIKAIIDELYAQEQAQEEPDVRSRVNRIRNRRARAREQAQPESAEGVTAGEEVRFISKVIDDERTNSLIVLANEEGHEAVRNLVAELDRDVDPANRAQIHVVYLEHAKAEDVASVLSELSQGGSSGSSSSQRPQVANQRAAQARQAAAESAEGGIGAIAAFDSGMRIAADENTNSLVIIANTEEFRVIQTVIEKLDIERKQVHVDVAIVELATDDTAELGLAWHLPINPGGGADSAGVIGAQLGAQSTTGLAGMAQQMLSGVALGVFGKGIEVDTGTELGTVTVPSFGIVLNALKSNSMVNIVSTPSITTLDNQEGEFSVGRKIPFPTSAGFSNLNTPIISFQREDVATSIKVTPRINSSNYVTLEVELEAQEVEEDDSLASAQGGPVTSRRAANSTVLVKDNQTVVLGGLTGTTESEIERKVPILGDLPVVGVLFRSKSKQARKTNLLIFLTPHIIDDPEDMVEVQRIKELQRQEFLRRFYGRSRDQYMEELRRLLRYSMNYVDEPSSYRGPAEVSRDFDLNDEPISDDSRRAIREAIQEAEAGVIPADPVDGDAPEEAPPVDGDPLAVPADEADVPDAFDVEEIEGEEVD